jgi:hypothetical protein
MAKIKYTAASPKAGQTEHKDNATAATLIAAGFAEAVVEPQRGSKGNGWLEARLEQSRLAGPLDPHSTSGWVNGTEWGVQTQKSGQVHVIKRSRGEVLFFDGPPQDCPASIRQQYLDAAAVNPEANAVAYAAAKKAQAEQDRKDKTAGLITVVSALFGSKPL